MINGLCRLPILVVSITVLSCGTIGCGDKNSDDGQSDEPDLSTMKPDYSLSSVEFSAEYKSDNKAARAKYKGKMIELTGKVVGVGRNAGKEEFLTLEATKGSFLQVICFTRINDAWLKASPGQTVKLRGYWPPIVVTAALVKCQILEVQGESCPRLSAEQLAKEFDADSSATAEKYKKFSHLILDGEVASKEVNKVGAAEVFLKHGGKCRISCIFTAFEKDLTQPLEAGQQITVIGEFSSFSANESSLTLYSCLLKGD